MVRISGLTVSIGDLQRLEDQGCEMADQPELESAIGFTATKNSQFSNEADQLDNAGQAILRLLHKAAGVAQANSQNALEQAQKLSHQLSAAERRIVDLSAEVRLYRDKAERAEEWLHKLYTEIDERLVRQPEEKQRKTFRP
jgi:outer membrane PBP1 activator LpoA protein